MKKNFVKTFAAIAVLLLAFVGFVPNLPEASADQARYFESQLTGNAAAFYNALESKTSSFKNGSFECEVSGITGVSAPATQSAYDALAEDFELAVAAFELDNPEIFYVDFDKLTLRLLNSNGGVKVYITAGAYGTFYVDGYTSASDVNSALSIFDYTVNEIVSSAGSAANYNTMLNNVYDALRGAAVYTEGYQIAFGQSAASVSTAAGVFCDGYADAEGFAKAAQVVFNALGIDSIVVKGTAISVAHDDWLQADAFLAKATAFNLVMNGGDWVVMNAGLDDANNTTAYKFISTANATGKLVADGIVTATKSLTYPALTGNVSASSMAGQVGVAVSTTNFNGAVIAPTLINNGDISVYGWTLDNGNAADTMAPANVKLVYNKLADGNILFNKYVEFCSFGGRQYNAIDAYELELFLNGDSVKFIEESGQRINVVFPYPAGYSYTTANTVYEALVFDKYEGHQLSLHRDVDSIECIPTPYGLVVDLAAFDASPYNNSSDYCNYAILAKSGTTSEKNVVTIIEGNGSVNGAYIQTFSSGSVYVQSAPNLGALIDGATINGAKINLVDRLGMMTAIDYATAETTTIVKVTYLDQNSFAWEQDNGLYSQNSQLEIPDPGPSPTPSDPAGDPDNGGNEGGGCFASGAITAGNFILIAGCLLFAGIGKGLGK